MTAGRRKTSSGTYGISNGLLRFDTSGLPDDAVITSATLRIYMTAKADGDNRSLAADWYTAWPIDASDFTSVAGTTAIAGVDITGLTVQSANDVPLQNLTSISLTGYTGLRLHVDGGVPAADNVVQFASLEHTTRPEPQLIITYTLPGP